MEPTRINAHLTLREYRGGIRYGTDALLLASFVRGGRRARCADLGTGCGGDPAAAAGVRPLRRGARL